MGTFEETTKMLFAEHFCQLTDEVIVPLFKNLGNIEKFPRCLVNDIKQQVKYILIAATFSDQRLLHQVHELSTTVYQIRGHIKGKTLLPLPRNATHIQEEEKRVFTLFSRCSIINRAFDIAFPVR